MATETKVSVLIVDDHAIVREGIAEVLSRSGQFEVVGQAADGDEAVAQVRELRPDVVIMDILMPGKSGIEACREIVAVVPDTRALMLTASNKQSAIVESTSKTVLQDFARRHTAESTTIYTDEYAAYQGLPRPHETVKHSVGEYVRGMASTNGLESHWALFQRGLDGVYHHVSPKHLVGHQCWIEG